MRSTFGLDEHPFTVDAGHIEIDVDIVGYNYNKTKTADTNTRPHSFHVMGPRLKVGMTNNTEIGLYFENYQYTKTQDISASTNTRRTGIGDTRLRVKWNMWGNDSGSTSAALIPYLKFPTNSNRIGNKSFEGGLIFPLNIAISDTYSFCFSTTADLTKNSNGKGHEKTYTETATFSIAATKSLSVYVEAYGEKATDPESDPIVTLDAGGSYNITDNTQIYFGLNLGVTKSADKYNPFLGMAFRF